MAKLTDMKMSRAEVKEYMGPADSMIDNAPRYPWGLCIQLDNDSLEKLGLDLPEVGEEMTLTATVKVTSVSSNETEGSNPSKSVSLQITDMALTGGDEADETSTGRATKALYK
jgi:hypothetical protein